MTRRRSTLPNPARGNREVHPDRCRRTRRRRHRPQPQRRHGARDKTTFDNCTDAYEHGHANIPESSEHYEDKLDRDQDGKGCDTPPADFVEYEGNEEEDQEQPADPAAEPNLAETGGDDMTAYYAAGGAVVLLAGVTVLVVSRKRRTDG